MSPKTMPVMTADGHRPSDPRRAVKKKPRKKNSSASGATTQTSTATAASATADLSAPSCCGRSSSSLTPTACMNTDHRAENTKNPSQATSSQPTAGQNRVGRRPNCQALGLRVRNANSTAHSTRPPSWMKVAAMLTAGVGLVLPVTATPISSAKVAIANVPTSASAGRHQGQRGGRAGGGKTPAGRARGGRHDAVGQLGALRERGHRCPKGTRGHPLCDDHRRVRYARGSAPPVARRIRARHPARAWLGRRSPRMHRARRLARRCLRAHQSAVRRPPRRPRVASACVPGFRPRQRHGRRDRQWLAFRSADRSLSLFSLVVPPGSMTPVHDHLAWGLVGVYRGNQDEEFYRPLDGRGLELVRRRPLDPGDFYTLLPPRDDVHRVRTTSEQTSVSIHLLANDTGCVWRHTFDEETGAASPFRSGYVNAACEADQGA